MKKRILRRTVFGGILLLSLLSAAQAPADIIILKNGQILRDVTVRDEGDTLYCENETQSFYINKQTVQNIIRTGPRTLPEQAREFVTFLPERARRFAHDYQAFSFMILLVLLVPAALIVFKFLWINLKPAVREGARRKDIVRAVRHLDADEQSVLREFYIQEANTLEMPVEDRVVAGLIKKGILQTTRDKGEYASCGLMLPVILSATAQKHVKPSKIGMPADIKDPAAREKLAKTRPAYMYELAGFYKSLETKARISSDGAG
ncbi:MAG: hypothetical protein COX19_07330 [Desulfobacterales bacterium CG23_combo_of_CG06-09_8_20_14_all_51_8]|nr:MAG: hypothetical protein COX19_07330 [Desulfobacterales bacterium CG23_combo_of_CG06-09_8_20_14_all_51_8]